MEFINSPNWEPATSTSLIKHPASNRFMEWQILRENPQNDKNPWEQPCSNTPNATKGHSSCISMIPRPLLNPMLDPISVSSWAAGRVFGLSVVGILAGEKQRVKAGTVFYSDIPQFKNNPSTSSLTHSMKGAKFLLWSFKRRCAKEEQEEKGKWEPWNSWDVFFICLPASKAACLAARCLSGTALQPSAELHKC